MNGYHFALYAWARSRGIVGRASVEVDYARVVWLAQSYVAPHENFLILNDPPTEGTSHAIQTLA